MEEKIKGLIAEQEKKVNLLLKEKSEELGLRVAVTGYSKKGDLHVLCEREFDKSFVVWTSYYSSEENSSFVDFYNGKYDMTFKEGFEEFEKRTGDLLKKELVVPTIDCVIWSVDKGYEDDSAYLIDPEDVEEKIWVNDHVFLIEGVTAVEAEGLVERIEQHKENIKGVVRLHHFPKDMEVFLHENGYENASVTEINSNNTYIPLVDISDSLVFNVDRKEFSPLGDYDTAKIYEFDKEGHFERLILHDTLEGVTESEVKITKDSVLLDEWDGFNFVTGGMGEHQRVYKVMETGNGLPSANDLYLLEKSSDWSGTHTKAEIMNEEELVRHIEELGDRNIKVYMTEIKALDGSVYEPIMEKTVLKKRNSESSMER